MHDEKLYIVMVGLPARGKSTLAIGLLEAFRKSHIQARIFNNGNLRRKYRKPQETSLAHFYHPDNREAAALRKKLACINLERARTYIHGMGQVAVIDATNVSRERRKMIEERLDDHPIIFIECLTDDEDILALSILEKTKLAEFSHMDRLTAEREFLRRIDYYRMIYTPLTGERNYIRLDSLNHKIIEEKHSDAIPLYLWVRDFLVTDVVKNLFLIRHTETEYNLVDRIGGDPSLTAEGVSQARALGQFFSRRKIAFIFTSSKLRTVHTARLIAERQGDCRIIPLGEFDEINGGVCEGMTYRDIGKSMPEVFQKRESDKYHYVYPGGESYETMKPRIRRGIKKAFFINRHAGHIMIVGHQAVNRMILSHFLYRPDVDVPYIYVPQDRFYHIIATHGEKQFKLRSYTSL